ncbi:ester cyclase [Kribbella sp. NPDC005582]|uniref:ester cyclase n=1 Tax=Kribbella sp. NPDC005582 TaxID=3156893 RepID=UPI0033B9D9E1
MTTTTPTAVAVGSIQIMADGEFADFERFVHPEAVNREDVVGPPEGRTTGPAAFYATALWLRAAFADLAYDIHHVVADGDLVTVNSTMNGRHVAPFALYTPAGEVDTVFPPTGGTFAASQSHWFRIKDGQVVDHWANRDDLGQAKQLGWVPPSPLYLIRMARAKARLKRAM